MVGQKNLGVSGSYADTGTSVWPEQIPPQNGYTNSWVYNSNATWHLV